MTDRLWNGTAGTPGDLSDTVNYTPNGLPISGDSLLFIDSTQAVTANYAALAAVDLVDLILGPGQLGALGASGSEIEFGNITTLRAAPGADCWIEAATITTLEVDGSKSGITASPNMLQLVAGSSLSITDLIIHGAVNGWLTIPDSTALNRVRVSGVTGSNFQLDIGGSVSWNASGYFRCDSGRVLLGTAPPDLIALGNAVVDLEAGAGDLTGLLMLSDQAILNYLSGDDITGLAEVWQDALLDLRANKQTGTITFDEAWAMNGGTIDGRNPQRNLAITAKKSAGGNFFGVSP